MISGKRIFTGLGMILAVMAFVIVVLFSWSGTGWKALSIPTGSMRPAIPPGSAVLVHKVSPQSLKVGDVITYRDPLDARKTISHRIIDAYMINGKIPAFITKGDANKLPDQTITEGLVEGKVIWHVPHVGSWLIWGKEPIGLLALIYIPALFLMAEEVKRMSDYLKSIKLYQLPGFRHVKNPSKLPKRIAATTAGSISIVIIGLFVWAPASALLQSSTVMLVNNRIAAKTIQPPPVTECSNHTNVNITNNSSQTATSGSATSSGNTNGGTATSGTASNTNSTNNTVTITNSC